jgi:hypothetical protein
MDNSISKMVIYPNPGKGLFAVRLPVTANVKAELKVTDATGKLVYHQTDVAVTPGGQIDLNLTNLPDGVYSLKVMVDENVHSSKLIIQHN